ncbi:MAG TPA: zinc ribbon domain-containing protein [Oscillospiraceae bacterium]|nr:zinc ribbon domain-containing protein [Oscillospiraceae bacterium]
MAFLDKLNDIAKNIGDKTSDAIETTKLMAKISSEKSAISDLTKKIGEYYCARRAAGETLEAEAEALYAQIVEHEHVIAQTRAEMDRVKAEGAAAAPAAAAAGKTCPSCGAALAAGARFCGECGTKIDV